MFVISLIRGMYRKTTNSEVEQKGDTFVIHLGNETSSKQIV